MTPQPADEPRVTVWDFAVGDRVWVFDDCEQQWSYDGRVLEVASTGVRVCFAKGSANCVMPTEQLRRLEPVTVNVYDLGLNGVKSMNSVLRLFGSGAYHTGVQVYGREYAFGDASEACPKGHTGIYSDEPRRCQAHSYRESVVMGYTALSKVQVRAVLERLQPRWLAEHYDFTSRNCLSFTAAMCREVGVQSSLPPWITRMSRATGHIENVSEDVSEAK